MHRLITARNAYQTSFHGLAVPVNSSTRVSRLPETQCSYCRKLFPGRCDSDIIFSSRHQSTKTAVLKTHRKKSKYKNHKQYGELLEVGETNMTETKVSISKLKPVHLSKLASSHLSLGQLHQITEKSNKVISSKTIKVDQELLQTVKEKLLKHSQKPLKDDKTVIDNDNCALLFTNDQISAFEDKIKTKQFINMVKESYYNFRRATIYDQRLKDLRYAINEGLIQEFDPEIPDTHSQVNLNLQSIPKSPHAIFREMFTENHLDDCAPELIDHLSVGRLQDFSHPAYEDEFDESSLHSDIIEQEDAEINLNANTYKESQAKSLNIKKIKEEIKQKKKLSREKRRALQELNMKTDMKQIERRSKQDALHKLLASHLQLLCSLDMIEEGRQVLQYYRLRSSKGVDYPKITDVKVHNILMHGYAAMGQLENTKELLSFMAQGGIEPNAQTFAAVFECIERSDISDKVSILNFYQNQMREKGLTTNDLLDKTEFLRDQRHIVLNAIRRLDPDFQPQYTPIPLDYDCPLMDKLRLDAVEERQGLLHSPAEGIISVEEMVRRGKEQLEMEMKGDIEVRNIDSKDEAMSPLVQLCREKLNETETEWRTVIREAFVRHLGTLKSQSKASHSAITLYPYLKTLKVDQFVDLIMGEISKLVDGSETYSPTLKILQRDLGTQVYHKYQVEQYRRNGVLDKIEEIYEKYCEWYITRKSVDGTGVPYNPRQAWQALLQRYRDGASLNIEEAEWPREMRQNVGKFLYNIIINDVKIDVNMFKTKAKPKKLPAVYKVHRPWGRLVRLELKPHPVLARAWHDAARPLLRMRTALLPALAPPAPWAAPHPAAHLTPPAPLVRIAYHVNTQMKRMKESPPTAMYPIYDSLNQLGEVPWVVNKPVLDIQLKIFRSGGNKKLDIPPPSSALDTSQFGAESDAPAVFKRRVAISKARADMHSLWCDTLYKLSLANHFRDSVFWLPHNLDFRGRVYACPPHLSALGADAARALLLFAAPRPLGPAGLRWLRLHAVNLTGEFKRHTVRERLEHADKIMDLILDSADRPLDGKGWWKRSEEPWQTLACCMEIANAVRSPNPEEYITGFPIHQDGSCNGLQHYAALGGDATGAAAVNLAPADRPQDVYSAVVALVEEMRARDAAKGVTAAIILENFVRRKVIKQTVMTTVYGVTKFGARLQIAKQLKDIDDFPKEHVWTCSQYLTTKTFESLQEMFTSTKLIQDWFTDCAKLVSGVCGESMEWVTPLGLPVVQPYYRRVSSSSATKMPIDQQQRPCTMKQRNAFPPNFIHSLDSSHMMLTGLRCQAAGVTFVSVHDCFWTHPAGVARMNRICRQEFVALHSQPILEDLSKFLVKRYSYAESELEDGSMGSANKRRVNNVLKKVPKKGNFDLNSVMDSVYFFS